MSNNIPTPPPPAPSEYSNNVMDKWQKQLEQRNKAYAKARKHLWDDLLENGITSVEVDFDGSGDSGQINHVKFLRNKQEMKGNVGSHKPSKCDAGRTLTECVEEICYSLLCQHHGGWEINEGSYGTFVLDVLGKTAELTFNERVESVDTTTHTYE